MKKIIYAVLMTSLAIQSCKKNSEQSFLEEDNFYPIGTILKTSGNVIVLGKTPDTNAIPNKINGKTSYFPNDPEPTIEQPYLTGRYAPYALGSYTAWTGVGTPNVTIAKSNNLYYRLIYQTDGNLVLYNGANQALWSSRSQNASTVRFQGDGNIVMLRNDSGNEVVAWSAGVGAGPNPIWVLQDDGNFVGYSNHTNNGFDSITITGSAYGSTGTSGGKKSSRFGKIK